MWRSLVLQVRFQHFYTGLAVVLVVSFLAYSHLLVQRLAQGEEARIAFYAKSLEFVASYNNPETEFLFNTVVKRQPLDSSIISVPAIITDAEGTPIFDNLDLGQGLTPPQRSQAVARELQQMKAQSIRPIRIEYVPGQFQYVYYRESDVLARLRYYPYILLAVLAVFVGGAFLNLRLISRNQQNRLWAGLAKETAHQLGTPIMGLLAWIELLRDRFTAAEDHEVLEEMARDVHHLEQITERFSKIGSEPELQLLPLAPILDDAVAYVRSRLAGSRRIQVILASELPPGFSLPINPTLFAWVIENLVKNAIDALVGVPKGSIVIRAQVRGQQCEIEVEDTGKGIAKGKVKDIFKPGFTTKARGWGLGLSLSKRIIELYHGGKIFVRRTEVGKGTTFRINFPLGRDYRPSFGPGPTGTLHVGT